MPVTIVRVIRAHAPQTYSMRRERMEDYRPSNWGEMVRSIRTDQGISQRQLAKMAKVNRNALRRMETNSSPCSTELLERVILALGYELDLHQVMHDAPREPER